MIELENEESDLWDDIDLDGDDEPGEGPTPEQRVAFEERLDIEVKRVQKQKRQIAQTHTTHRRKIRTIFYKLGTVAAVLAVIILASFCFPDSAIASGFNHILSTVLPDQGAEELRLEEKEDPSIELNIEDFAGMYVPTWIPRGFRIAQVINGYEEKAIYYRNKYGDNICFHISKRNGSFIVDDEDVQEEPILICGEWGKKIVTDSLIYIVWENGDYLYSLSGQKYLLDELIKVAEKCSMIGVE